MPTTLIQPTSTTRILLPGEPIVPIELTDKGGTVARPLLTGLYNAVQMALAELYMKGVVPPDRILRPLFRSGLGFIFRRAPSLFIAYPWVMQETDHIAEVSKDLMKIQYDLPQQMLNTMLGDSETIYPKYSMGLWERGAKNLEESQIHMIDQVIERLGIKDGDNILDFGCGWGGVPNYILSKFPNVRMTGLNLSHEQCNYMRDKMRDPKSHLSRGRFKLIEGDLNTTTFDEKFDKILTIGVFCHVGNLTQAFAKLAAALKDEGKVFIHIITAKIRNNVSSPFSHKYIFPTGRYWRYDAVPLHNNDLKTVQRWYLNGNNYSRTLEEWLKNFDDNQPALRQLDYGMKYARFRRMWRLYLLAFIEAFACSDGEIQGNGQYLLVKK